MATPPEQTSRPGYGYTPGTTLDFARLPIPGNAEFLVYLIVMIIVSVIALASKKYNIGGWIHTTEWLTAAYLISRGIAKASRVLEQ
ncbi:MAG: hypothetical protein E6G45_02575 [Actinobacteria bacterium]|nr:MAG: hypothetical protein E6G45_02575 [Actinomycetota bacterium]